MAKTTITKRGGVWGRGAQMDPRTWDREKTPGEGEKEMWTQCLVEAIRCTQGYVADSHSRLKRLRTIEEARAWFTRTTTDIGTFLWVCAFLDLDPDKIRSKIVVTDKLLTLSALQRITTKRLALRGIWANG